MGHQWKRPSYTDLPPLTTYSTTAAVLFAVQSYAQGSVLLKMSGLQKELAVSDDLAKILGTKKGEKISRPQCTKRLWAYLKENKLQDPQNKQWFTPDETMAPIFGTEKIKCFSMAKYLKEHLTNPAK